jgi:hypothetical protein
MNERIRELNIQAINDTKHDPADDINIQIAEKFAELIVRECMKLNSKELSITAIERLLPLYEEHFGVEE